MILILLTILAICFLLSCFYFWGRIDGIKSERKRRKDAV